MRAQGYWRDEVLTDAFDRAVNARPDAIAVMSVNTASGRFTRKTYAELAADVARVARGLRALGAQPGDVVSVQLPNWWQFVAIVLACTRLGCIVNPVMPTARDRELVSTLRLCKSRVLFVPRHFRGMDYEPLIASFRHGLSDLETVIAVDDAAPSGFAALPDPVAEEVFDRTDADALTEIIFTSGTTGDPKGVMHTSNTLISATRGLARRLELGAQDVIFMGSPLAHQTGFLWGVYLPILLDAKVVLLDIWSPTSAAALIAAEQATFSVSAPTFLFDLLAVHESGEASISSMRTFVLAGAPVPRVLVERAAAKTGIRIASAWGMTEVALPTISHPDDDVDTVSRTDGSIVEGMELRIVDAAGEPVPDGLVGRLQVRGAFNFVGYLERPDLFGTDADGWFETGDLAHTVSESHLRITGRTKDIIIRGGEKVPVADIEDVLYRHPAIADVAIVAMPDERLGERACAFVTTRKGTDLSLNKISSFLTANGVTKTYFPEHVEIIEEMPRTPSGKIQKFVLREWAAELVRRKRHTGKEK